jgi:Na+-transporting NADH:ubiquinone oxidoreductase subunit F
MTSLLLRKLHRWVALVVGVQVLLWTLSGTVFAWLDHGAVTGDGLALATVPAPALAADVAVVEPARLPELVGTRTVRALSLRFVDGQWVYRVAAADGVHLRRARDGARLDVDAGMARRLAATHYRGGGRLESVRHHANATLETRDAGPTWEAAYRDAAGTRLYFSAEDATLVAVRTDAWRLKDVFWMLHTMDYRGRDDFNNPLVMLAGTAAAWVALTGLWLLVRVLRART